MKHARTVVWLLGLAVYAVLFYATPLPGSGKVRRVAFLSYLVLPDDLARGWFGAPPDFSLVDRLPVLLTAGVIVAYGWSLGWLLMALCGADRGLTRPERFVFSVAVGLNLVSTYVLVVGLLGRLDNLLVFAVPAALTLAAAGRLRWRRAWTAPAVDQPSARPRSASEGHGDWLSPRWLWLGAPFVLVILLGGMLPPVDFDVREYHLQVPKEFFQQGRIGFLPHNVYGNMALGTEMLSLLAMVIAQAWCNDWWLGALAGKTVIAAMAPLTALALFAAGRRFFSTAAGVVAAAVYISIPWIVSVSVAGLVEGASAYYLLLAVYAVLLWIRASKGSSTDAAPAGKGAPEESSPQRGPARKGGVDRGRNPSAGPGASGRGDRWLPLAGYLAGGAVSCKYPAALFVMVPLTIWVSLAATRADWRVAWRPVGVFLLAVFLGCGLWFGKNWALTGNPTYPLLYDVFGGKTRTPQKNRQWQDAHRPKDFRPGALAGDLARVGLTSQWLSPVVLPLAVLAFFDRRRRRLVLALAAYFGYVIAAWWLGTHRIDRFWIAAMPLLALLAGAGACSSRQRGWRWVILAVLLAGVAVNFPVAASGYNPYFVSLARLRRDPQRIDDPWHRYFNTHVHQGRVLMVGEAQVFDLEVPVLYNTCFDDCLFAQLVGGRGPGEVRHRLAAERISHVYVDWGEIQRYRTTYGFANYADPDEFVEFVRQEICRLVGQAVLEPLPRPWVREGTAVPFRGPARASKGPSDGREGHPGRGYRVRLD